jgi:multisubunit Na+/H+ antiporter MnhC subunit
MLANLPFLGVAVIAIIGLYTVVSRKNLIKIFMGLNLVEAAINLFLISMGYREGGIAPIYTGAPGMLMVLPTPQALTLTSIVIGVATTAMLISFAIKIYHHYGTVDTHRIRELRE